MSPFEVLAIVHKKLCVESSLWKLYHVRLPRQEKGAKLSFRFIVELGKDMKEFSCCK